MKHRIMLECDFRRSFAPLLTMFCRDSKMHSSASSYFALHISRLACYGYVIFDNFSVNFQFRADKVTSRAEPKILQLELWLEPARLGLITTPQVDSKCLPKIGGHKVKIIGHGTYQVGRSKIIENHRTSLMDVPQCIAMF